MRSCSINCVSEYKSDNDVDVWKDWLDGDAWKWRAIAARSMGAAKRCSNILTSMCSKGCFPMILQNVVINSLFVQRHRPVRVKIYVA